MRNPNFRNWGIALNRNLQSASIAAADEHYAVRSQQELADAGALPESVSEEDARTPPTRTYLIDFERNTIQQAPTTRDAAR